MVAQLVSMAVTTPRRLPLISVMSLTSMATSVPVEFLHLVGFVLGQSLGQDPVDPHFLHDGPEP